MSQQRKTNKIEICHYQVPKKTQSVSGDSFITKQTKDYFLCGMADGLGSGELASKASKKVTSIIEENHHNDVQALMEKCNRALKMERGAAVAIFKVYFESNEFVYSCVGNISFFLYSPIGKLTYPLPVMGYLSGKPQTFHTQRFPYQKDSVFVCYTDGLKLKSIKSLLHHANGVEEIEAKLKAYEKGRDDDLTFVAGYLR